MTDETSRLTGTVRRSHASNVSTTSYEVPSLSRPASTTSTGRPPSRRGALTPTLIVVALVVVGFIFFANVWTDVLWYQQLGFFEVFVTENLARIGIFAVGFAIMFAGVFFAIRIAYHARPVYAP